MVGSERWYLGRCGASAARAIDSASRSRPTSARARARNGRTASSSWVGSGVMLGGQRRDALRRPAEVPQRAGQLNHGAAAPAVSPASRACRYSGAARSEWPAE